jgi:hypothetical protein
MKTIEERLGDLEARAAADARLADDLILSVNRSMARGMALRWALSHVVIHLLNHLPDHRTTIAQRLRETLAHEQLETVTSPVADKELLQIEREEFEAVLAMFEYSQLS